MLFLQIKNFDKFQYYRHRNPPWIRLYTELLDDKEFHELPDASRALAPFLWLLGAKADQPGVLVYDVDVLAFKLRRSREWMERALEPLINAGFVIVSERDASGMLVSCKQDATSESETEREAKGDASNALARSPKRRRSGGVVDESFIAELEADVAFSPIRPHLRMIVKAAEEWAKERRRNFTRAFVRNWLVREMRDIRTLPGHTVPVRVIGSCSYRDKKPGERFLTPCGQPLYEPKDGEAWPSDGVLRYCEQHYRHVAAKKKPTKQEQPKDDDQEEGRAATAAASS